MSDDAQGQTQGSSEAAEDETTSAPVEAEAPVEASEGAAEETVEAPEETPEEAPAAAPEVLGKGPWVGKRVAVVYGGEGDEREISLMTGEALASGLEELGYSVERVDASPETLGAMAASPPDVALIAMHGGVGENGGVQGLLECLGVPYTGSGVIASAIAMHKASAKAMWAHEKLATPEWMLYPRSEVRDMLDRERLQVPIPCVVKPAQGGSSVGTTIVRKPEEMRRALRRALRSAGPIMFEGFVEGRELSVGIIDGNVMGIVEVLAQDGVYDYAAKYETDTTTYRIPAPLTRQVHERVARLALEACRAIGVRGVVRVDIMLDASDAPWLLEVNTVPGMTKTSLIPKIAARAGVEFARLAEMILNHACLDVEMEHA